MLSRESRPAGACAGADVRDQPAVGATEAHSGAAARLDRETPLVDEPVVEGAQLHEVAEVGPPAPRPVLDVVRMEEAGVVAAGEPASAIAASQRPPQGR